MLAIDDQRPAPAVPARMNLALRVLYSSGVPDDKLALVVLSAGGAERWSYGRLRARVLSTAQGLLAAGLQPGDRVLMRLGNSPDFPIVFLAAIAAGIVPVPTSAALGVNEISRISDDLSPDAIVAHGGIALPCQAPATLSPADLASNLPLETIPDRDSNAPAYIVYTSGTSGAPMGVIHAHRAILARQMMFDGWYGLRPDDRMLHAGAFNWTFTLGTGLLDPWTLGATSLVLKDGTPLKLLPLLAKRHEATILAGAPGVFRQLIKANLPTMPRLRHGLVAGEKLSEDLHNAWRAATGTPLHEAFGQSECSTFISGSTNRLAPPGTLGFAQQGRCLAILKDDAPCQRGEVGEIAVHVTDPGLTLGYLSQELQPRGEWMPTGDMGLMRQDGSVEYHGRADDILTAGGFRISPLEVENAMMLLDGIDEAAAVDHQVSADTTLIALHYTGAKLDDDMLAAHAEQHLARYKQPRLFVHAQALPKNANGKLLRKSLRTANEGAP